MIRFIGISKAMALNSGSNKNMDRSTEYVIIMAGTLCACKGCSYCYLRHGVSVGGQGVEPLHPHLEDAVVAHPHCTLQHPHRPKIQSFERRGCKTENGVY